MFTWIFSIMAGYKISEWICGPWPEFKVPAPPPLPEPEPLIPSEPETTDGPDFERYEEPEPAVRKISKFGIEFDEDMKYIGD